MYQTGINLIGRS